MVNPCFSFFLDTGYLGEDVTAHTLDVNNGIQNLEECLGECLKHPDCHGVDLAPYLQDLDRRYVVADVVREISL